jgi:hypothetical protein
MNPDQLQARISGSEKVGPFRMGSYAPIIVDEGDISGEGGKKRKPRANNRLFQCEIRVSQRSC